MEIISVNIIKGGCAKTTTVQALAEIFGKNYGKKVLCIDIDPQANLTSLSGVDVLEHQEHNLYTLLKGESTLAECIVKTKYYDIVPGTLLLAYADLEFNQLGREYFLREKIEQADYDLILIDTPPALNLLNIMALTASSKIIIPAECAYSSMIGFNQLFNTINSVRKHANKNLEILGILPTKCNLQTNLTTAIMRGLNDMAAQFGTCVFDTKIRNTVKICEAQAMRYPLVDWNISCTAMQDYVELARLINEKLA